jgi:hypothetical protein
VTDSKKLLEDTLQLLRKERDLAKVQAFAANWGPLWRCAYHSNERCYGSPSKPLPQPKQLPPEIGKKSYRQLKEEGIVHPTYILESLRMEEWCAWNGTEKAADYLQVAEEVYAVIRILAYLALGEGRRRSKLWAGWWETLGFVWSGGFPTLEEERDLLTGFINEKLDGFKGGPDFKLDWFEGAKVPTMAVDHGFGFLPSLWLQVAQKMANAHGLYFCDLCGSPFVAVKKRREGQRVFCSDCGAKGSNLIARRLKRVQ